MEEKCKKVEENKVSVIIAFYNESKYIKECIESVLQQSYANLEIILIDDCSTDDSFKIINCFNDERIIIKKNEINQGQAFSRNEGIRAATGKYIAFLDGDDISKEDRIRKEVEYLEEHPDIVAVSSFVNHIDETGNEMGATHFHEMTDLEVRAFQLWGNAIALSSSMVRKKYIDDNEILFDDKIRLSEDYFFWMKCLVIGNIHILPMNLVDYRVHQSHSKVYKKKNMDKQNKWMKEIIKYAWNSRGYKLSERQIDIISQIWEHKRFWKLKDFYLLLNLYYYINIRTNELQLPEAREIIKESRKRIFSRILYFWPLKVMGLFER